MNLAKGTRVRMTKPLQEGDKVGEIYTVERSNESVVVLTRSREYEVDNFMGSGFGVGICGYGVTSQEFSEHFEIIGMEKPKKFEKNAENEALVGDYTETELDYLWELAGSYEDLKVLLKLGVKWHGNKQKKRELPQREWTLWKIHPITGLPYSVSRPEGKSAKVKVKCGAFVGIASCTRKMTGILISGSSWPPHAQKSREPRLWPTGKEWKTSALLCGRFTERRRSNGGQNTVFKPGAARQESGRVPADPA